MARTPMTNRTNLSFTIGAQTHGIVNRKVVRKTDKYDSTKKFYEIAVRSNARTLQKIGTGGLQSRDLTILLGDIRGITVREPKDEARAFILDGELSDTRPRIELAPEQVRTLSEIQLETGLSQSEVIRRCVFRQLNHLSLHYGYLRGWRREEIQKVWEEVKAGMKRPRLQCHDMLRRKFVDEVECTQRNIEADLPAFERFANEYVSDFHDSKAYNLLQKERSDRTLRDVENVIEEYTDYSIGVEKPTTGFLDDLKDEVMLNE